MNAKQLKSLLEELEALKTPESSPEFQAGIDGAYELVNRVAKRAIARERKQQLRAELAKLEEEFPEDSAPKKRGRKPKQTTPENTEFETVTGA